MNIAPLALVVLVGCGTTPTEEWAEGQDDKVNPLHDEQCAEQGGCVLITGARLLQMLLKAYSAGQASKGSL